MTLYAHQAKGIAWLCARPAAGLWHEMGTGKSRTALFAAKKLFDDDKIDRVLVLVPSSVAFAWREEIGKLTAENPEKFTPQTGFYITVVRYEAKSQKFFIDGIDYGLPICIVSYGLLPQKRHADALEAWCRAGRTAMICDESSFLKNRAAKQTKAATRLASGCYYRWLLSGTPICNSPLDLYAQAKVMSPVRGPLGAYKNFYHFQASIGNLIPVLNRNNKPLMIVGRGANGRVGPQPIKRFEPHAAGLERLQKLFAPYVSRVEKKDCLDLPEKTYTVREVALSEATWKIYQELKKEAMLALPDSEAKPEPNAAVRILRLCQITSGHVGLHQDAVAEDITSIPMEYNTESGIGLRHKIQSQAEDISSEKLDFLAEEITSGELANEQALIVWCRWRRERERLMTLLVDQKEKNEIGIAQIYGGQSEKERSQSLEWFMYGSKEEPTEQRVLLAQPHAGGFGLNLTAAHTAVYLSNDFSFATRVQSEDRCHRIGQAHPVLYIDVVAVSPRGGQTIDHKILEALRAKKSIAEWTCSAWRRALED